MRTSRALTLIELLIIVTFIATLTAIAVHNFLEAQVRSRISSVHIDLHGIGEALEAHAMDHGDKYPMGYINLRQAVNAGGAPVPPYPSNKYERASWSMSRLTTPVAYMASIPLDPFTLKNFTFDSTDDPIELGPFPYWYDDYQPWPDFFPSGFSYTRLQRINEDGYRWSVASAGPEKSQMMMWYALNGVDPSVANNHIVFTYDPTNGTISEGFVGRTNKGIFTEVNQP